MTGGDMVMDKSRTGAVQQAKARLQKHKGVRSEVVLEAALELFSREEYKSCHGAADRPEHRHHALADLLLLQEQGEPVPLRPGACCWTR